METPFNVFCQFSVVPLFNIQFQWSETYITSILCFFQLKFSSMFRWSAPQRKCKCVFHYISKCNLKFCITNFLLDLDLEELSWQGLALHWILLLPGDFTSTKLLSSYFSMSVNLLEEIALLLFQYSNFFSVEFYIFYLQRINNLPVIIPTALYWKQIYWHLSVNWSCVFSSEELYQNAHKSSHNTLFGGVHLDKHWKWIMCTPPVMLLL